LVGSFFFFTFSTLIKGPKNISFYTLAKSLFNW
jgi:hypothetical protein